MRCGFLPTLAIEPIAFLPSFIVRSASKDRGVLEGMHVDQIAYGKRAVPMTYLINFACAFALVTLLAPAQAHAYVDPGSGSVIVTTILGLFAAIGYTFRKYFYKVKRRLFGSKDDTDTSDEL
ncbi:MAG: hypothetical protein AAFO70_06445 [Pseudomonadota bacterium]